MKKTAFLWLGACLSTSLWSQSFCSSDGQPPARALVERFISADCADCWSAPQPELAKPGALVLDWIVPGSQGDEAPLAAAASSDALTRLQSLGQDAPRTTLVTRQTVTVRGAPRLRVVQGVAIGDYVGATIEIIRARTTDTTQDWSVWLAMVETVPAGVEGTLVTRYLVRNLSRTLWNIDSKLPKQEQMRFYDLRTLRFAQGASPDRLRLLGWVQDARGQVLAASQTVCSPNK